MSRLRILVGVVIATVLIVASSAAAKTIAQSGQVFADANSRVTLQVLKKKKKLKKVKAFQFENVTAECQGNNPPIEASGALPTMKVVNKKQFSATVNGAGDAKVTVRGTLSNKGKSA